LKMKKPDAELTRTVGSAMQKRTGADKDRG
jgi:hypothetical protein